MVVSRRWFLGLLLVLPSMGPASPPGPPVRGQVRSADTNEAIEGAGVGIQGSAIRTTTNQEGKFELAQQPRSGDRIVAWRRGYFIGGADWNGVSEISLSLKRLPVADSPEYDWIDPGPDPSGSDNCANCHAEIYRQWSASSHAQAAVNRHFLNVFNGDDWNGRPDTGWNFSRDQPDALAVCSACHLPSVSADHPAATNPTQARGVAREGIHCDFCHKIAGTEFQESLESLGLQHGRDALHLLRPARGEQVFFGPFDDVDRGRDSFAPLYGSSLYCASCHEGTLFGTRAYETFSEWRSSPSAKQGTECQHCHMAPDGKMLNMAPGHGGINRDPAKLASHTFPGSVDEAFMRSSVELSLTGRREGSQVRLTVRVTPKNVGHRLPTGSPERHLILVVGARTSARMSLRLAEGPVVPAAGGMESTRSAGYAGRPGKIFGKLLRGPGGSTPAPFWQATGVEFDSRLFPDQTDQTVFIFDLPDPAESTEADARLIYRRFYHNTLDQKSWPDRDLVLAEVTMDLL